VPFRQVTFFRIGCWASIVTAVAHFAGHLFGAAEPANDTENTLIRLATTYEFEFPDGARRTLMDLMDGMSLSFVVLLVVMGGIGLIVAKRGQTDGPLMTAAARVMAVGSIVLLVISLNHWFLTPSLLIAVMAFAFAFAAVRPPERSATAD
jgi:hypothetical protein